MQHTLQEHSAIKGNGLSTNKNSENFLSFVKDNVEGCQDILINLQNIITSYIKFSGYGNPKILNKEMQSSWFNIQNEGSSLNRHTHALSTISGAIYINVDDDSSMLYFYNPNQFNEFSVSSKNTEYTYDWYKFKPKNGDLFLFPSWLAHGSNGDQNNTKNRTVISFNL